VVKRSADAAAGWYNGPTLMEALESAASSTTTAAVMTGVSKPFRLPVAETYKSDNGEWLVSGRISNGSVQIGDKFLVQPSGTAVLVHSIKVHGTEPREWAVAGENVEISFGTGTNASVLENVAAGDVVCPADAAVQASTQFLLRGLAFEHLLPMPLEVHRGRLKADAQIESMPALLDKATGVVVKKRPKMMAPGAYGLIKFVTTVPVVLESGQRVVLRAEGKTVAAGVLE